MAMKIRSVLSALAGALLVSGAASAQEPKRGGVLSFALTADIRSLDASRNDSNTDSVLNHIYEQLVAYRNDLSVGPALAESWTVSEDGKVYTFRIRDGAAYHNGDKVLAADFKWLWDRRMAPARVANETRWLCAPVFDGSRNLKVESVAAPDERSIVFTLNAPDPLFLTRLADVICNIWVASPKNVDAAGAWIANSAIGSGSFKLKEWQSERHVVLQRFDGYVPLKVRRDGYSGDRTAYVDEVRFVVVPDKTASETALIAGQIDVVSQLQATRIEDMKKRGVIVQTAPGLSLTAVLMQTKDPLLANPKLRLAIAHSLDLAEIARVKTESLSPANPSGVPQSSAYADPVFGTWPAYDPERAKALLREAGYKGETIKIEANKRFIGMYETAVLVQAMMVAVGIKAEIELLDWGAQLQNFFNGKFQMSSFGYSSRTDPLIIYGMLIGDKSKVATVQWDDPRAVALITEAGVTPDFARRKAILAQIQALMAEQVPILPLYYFPVIEAISPKLGGYESWALDKPRAWGVWKK